jgi:hypothetical protein
MNHAGHGRGHNTTFCVPTDRPEVPRFNGRGTFMFLECQNENTVAATFPLKSFARLWFPKKFSGALRQPVDTIPPYSLTPIP